VTPGVYKWTWGTGTHQSFTLDIGTAVPEPSTWAMMALGSLASASSVIARHAAATLWRN
jgi:PEP-CTERM motif